MKPVVFLLLAASVTGWWLTPDQQGFRQFKQGEFAKAAEAFDDPYWRGVSYYRAGEFESAAREFSRRDSAEANFNEGNARLMWGKYDDAIACYERALTKRPEWLEAIENRDLAAARAKMVEAKGGDMGDQKIGADEIVFDNKAKKNKEGQDTETAGGESLSDKEIQALWLRRVQTKPADFLKSKFAFQHAQRKEERQ